MKYVLAIALAAVLFGISMNASATGKPEPQNQQQGQIQGQGQRQTVNGGSVNVRTGSPTLRSEQSLSVTSIHQAQERNPASSVYAPSINPTANCAVPVVAGVQVTGFGVSGGSAYESDTCVTIEQAKVATHTFGDPTTGEELMCGLEKYRAARKAVNRPCLADTPHTGAVITEACLDPSGNPYTDPLVTARACPAK